jgi:two-component system chemotaxis sensor kinase CheA
MSQFLDTRNPTLDMALKWRPAAADGLERNFKHAPMPQFTPEQLAKLTELTSSIGLELVFAEVGKDVGLLPANNLLTQIEEITGDAGHEEVDHVVEFGRAWIDQIFNRNGIFDAQSIQNLNACIQWLQRAWDELGRGQPVPEPPSDWSKPDVQDGADDEAALGAAAPGSDPEEPLLMNVEADGDLIREFTNESHEHLQNIELGVLTLEENPKDMDTLNSIFRAFHTFKGGSGFLNLKPINRLAHELESLLDLARQNKLEIDSEVINIILSGGDTLKQFVAEVEMRLAGQGSEATIIPIQPLIRRTHRAMGVGPAADVPATESPEPVPAPATVTAKPAAPVESTNIVPLPSAPADEPAKAAPQKQAAQTDGHKQSGATSVKVDTLKLDALVDLVGEMVIAQSLVAQHPDVKLIQNQQFTRNLSQLCRITKDLQKTAMSLRMVPIRGTFQKMQRLVRDVAVKSGKQVDLVTVGEEIELDRTITEEINDPLVHMIRNSVDHGIEKPEIRVAKGKSPHGRVTLSAFHQGGNIVIQIKDDGAGLNKERILAKAVEQGIIEPGSVLADKDIFALIFAAGFSTAEKVTDLSGRGVGMDVVRQNIEKLRGKIEIESVTGEGSTFTIYLPLTLAIIDGMIITVGHHRYIIPTLSVRESFRPTREMVSTVHGRGEMVNVRGRINPLVRLHEVFGLEGAATDPAEAIFIVVESGSDTRCLMVDDLLGKQEVVIKSLGDTFKSNKALAGAAILGDGRVGLILDVDALVRLKPDRFPKAA